MNFNICNNVNSLNFYFLSFNHFLNYYLINKIILLLIILVQICKSSNTIKFDEDQLEKYNAVVNMDSVSTLEIIKK